MHRIVVNVQTKEIQQIPYTAKEVEAKLAYAAQVEAEEAVKEAERKAAVPSKEDLLAQIETLKNQVLLLSDSRA